MNVKKLSDKELNEKMNDIVAEIHRRKNLVALYESAPELRVLEVEPGEVWREPLGDFDAYPIDWVVEHDGVLWISTINGNVWEPGRRGWEIRDEQDSTASSD